MADLVLREFIPGVGVGPEGIPFLCPGCWAHDLGLEVPSRGKLVAWFLMGISLLLVMGYNMEGSDPKQMAADYTEEPWHVD